MRRPLPAVACGLATGIAMANLVGHWAVPVALFCCLFCVWRASWRKWSPLLVALAVGAVWLLCRSPVWPTDYGPAQSVCEVKQVNVEQDGVSLTVRLRSLSGKVIPAWNTVFAHLYFPLGEAYSPGDILTGSIDWQQPDQAQNPGQFSFQVYERRQGILASAFIQPSDRPELERRSGGDWALRAKLQARAGTLPGEAGELLSTLLLGSSAGAWAEAWRKSGLAHVLAVSGLHVGLLLGMVWTLLGWLRVPARWRYLLGAGLLLGYGFLVGPLPSVWRAIIMSEIGILALATGRLRDWESAMAAAAILLLIYNPWFLFGAGFQLSFAATWGVLALSPVVTARLPLLPLRLDRLLATSLAAQAATLPIVLYHFYLFTPLALLSNLLVVPLLLPLLLLLGLLYLLFSPFIAWLLPLVKFVYSGVLILVNWLAEIPAMSISPGQPPLVLVMLAMVLLAVLWQTKSPIKVARVLGSWLLVVMIMLCWQPGGRFVQNRYQFRALAVGQGVAAVLHFPGSRAVLFDVGGGSDRVGTDIIVPYLRQQGTTRISDIFLSHLDADHVRGLADVLAAFPVDQIRISALAEQQTGYSDLVALSSRYAVPLQVLWAGDELRDLALRISVLYPTSSQSHGSANEDSLVLQLMWPNLRILLPGDISSAVETELLPSVHAPLDILLVAHHGSANSSGEQFLAALAPQVGIISTGPNQYGHPSKEALARLNRYSQRVLRTDRVGAVLVWTNLRRFGVDSFLTGDP